MKSIQDIARDMERLYEKEFRMFWEMAGESSKILSELNPIKRKPFLRSVIADLLRDQQGKCALCGITIEGAHHVDHIVPFSLSGGNERGNLRIAHPLCNQRRGNSAAPSDVIAYLEDRAMNY